MLRISNQERYREERSKHNNKTMFTIAIFLLVEQMLYGLLFTEPGTLISHVHLWTVLGCFYYSVALGWMYWSSKHEGKTALWKELIQFSFIGFGFAVAIFRAVYISSLDFSVPVIFIAVLYGSAFLFYYPPIWTSLLYGGTFLTFILLNNHVNNGVLYPTFVEDILMNSILAWIGSFLAHYRFLKQVNSFVQIEEQNKALIQLSEIDALTQINNRRALDRELDGLHRKAQEKSGTYAMIIADIDHFKKVNDKYGHIIGDEVLVETVSRFKRIIGDKHIIGRWGGEEFMVILNGTSLEEACEMAELIRKEIQQQPFANGCHMTCSFGVSAYKRGVTSEDVVRKTDKALYFSKENGRNQVNVEV